MWPAYVRQAVRMEVMRAAAAVAVLMMPRVSPAVAVRLAVWAARLAAAAVRCVSATVWAVFSSLFFVSERVEVSQVGAFQHGVPQHVTSMTSRAMLRSKPKSLYCCWVSVVWGAGVVSWGVFVFMQG